MKKNCWIIGSSHGIGEAIARKYYEEGYDIIISARSSEKLESLKSELLGLSLGNVLVSAIDVSNLSSLEQSFAEILKKFQKIDLVIFCPALYQPMSAINFDLDISKKIIDVNLIGFLNFLHLAIPQMAQQKSGQIAVIASIAGYCGLPQSFAYGASKAALINLCEGIYPELQREGIALSVINPGFVKTRLTDKNKFKMPFLISSEKAAEEIWKGLIRKDFEIHFPKKFTFFLKVLRLLPYRAFFFITKKIT